MRPFAIALGGALAIGVAAIAVGGSRSTRRLSSGSLDHLLMLRAEKARAFIRANPTEANVARGKELAAILRAHGKALVAKVLES